MDRAGVEEEFGHCHSEGDRMKIWRVYCNGLNFGADYKSLKAARKAKEKFLHRQVWEFFFDFVRLDEKGTKHMPVGMCDCPGSNPGLRKPRK